MSNGYTTRRYKGRDPFRPQPELRVSPKSRRHHPITQDAEFCIRKYKDGKIVCKNWRRCNECFPAYKLWEPAKKKEEKK
jgi:hypothetical protein